jgi:hypothetical protein
MAELFKLRNLGGGRSSPLHVCQATPLIHIRGTRHGENPLGIDRSRLTSFQRIATTQVDRFVRMSSTWEPPSNSRSCKCSIVVFAWRRGCISYHSTPQHVNETLPRLYSCVEKTPLQRESCPKSAFFYFRHGSCWRAHFTWASEIEM